MSIDVAPNNVVSIHVPARAQPAAPAPRRKATAPKLGAFICQCPTTKADIGSGIEMDERTFRKIGKLHARIECPACHCVHMVKIASGTLALLGQDHSASQ